MSFFQQWTKGLRAKFLILMVIPSLTMAAFFMSSLSTFKDLEGDIMESLQQEIPSALSLGALNASLVTMTVNLHEAVGATSLETQKIRLAEAKNEYDAFKAEMEEFKKYELSDEETQLFTKFQEDLKAHTANVEKVFAALEANDVETAKANLNGPYSETIDPLDKAFSAMDSTQTKSLEVGIKESNETISSGKSFLLTIGFIGLGCILGIGFFTANRLANSIAKISETLAFSSMEVNSAATQISSTSDDLSQSSVSQAAALQEIVSSVDEINSMISTSTDHANTSVALSRQSFNSAEHGKQVVDQMKSAIQDISESNAEIMKQINESNKELESIVRIIEEIGQKTLVINDIVFQTKLLSFNASVEAARAGEYGKGFAVVAEEVGSLAQMSGTAAHEISQLLENSRAKVSQTVSNSKSQVEILVNRGKQKVESGVRITQECDSVLSQIVENVSKVNEVIAQITEASNEQRMGVREITKAMNMLDQMTQTNTASSGETAQCAEGLSTQAHKLKGIVDELVLTVSGDKSDSSEKKAA